MRFLKAPLAAVYVAAPRAPLMVVVLLVFTASVPACTKPLIRETEHAIAEALCRQSMAEQPALLGGKTAEEICAIAEVLQPFFDELIAAKKRAMPAAAARVQQGAQK